MPLNDILFSKSQKLIDLAKIRVVQEADCLPLPSHLNPRSIPWDESKIDWSDRKNFLRSFMRVSWPTTRIAIGFQIAASILAFLTPFLVHAFLSRLQTGNFEQQNLIELISLAIGLGICGGGQGVIIQHYFYRTLEFNQITTNVVNKKIFSHSLKLSSQAKNKFQVGDIVNFMSSDSDAIADSSITVIDLTNAVVLLVGCTASLFYFIGWSAAVALVVMGLLVPFTQKLSKTFMHLEDQMMKYRDQRMTLMTQVMNAIRVVKYFVWEKSVLEEVGEVRRLEIHSRYQLARAEISWGLIYTSISTIVLFAALLTHILRGKTIDLALIFTCISIFAMMEDHFGNLSKFISRYINILVSSDRITAFLKSDQVGDLKNILPEQKNLIQFRHLDFTYPNQPALFKNLDFNITAGSSLAIVGPVGAGKSTLLQLMLSELNPSGGDIRFQKDLSKAYVSQDAFIVNASLKENIIFGAKNHSAEKIRNALHVSALEYDLLAWPSGLETEIGEKGVNLSGGQKQRVSLARAVMADADLILLDDPLSAVDPSTEMLLSDRLLFGFWKHKTRVVVTHRLESLNRFDQILFVQDGQHFLGTFDQLSATCAPFKSFLRTHENNKGLEKDSYQSKAVASTEAAAVVPSEAIRITDDEDRAIGAVEKSVYIDYIKAMGGESKWQNWVLFALFISAIALVLAPMGQKMWLSQSNKLTVLTPLQVIYGYGALGVLTMLITFISTSFWTFQGIKAGQIFHDAMLKSVLATRMRFFDSTPVGRILQRFSRDVESVDIHLQWSFNATINALFQITISFLLIVFVLPWVILFLLPVLYFYYKIQNDYRRVAREVKRLDSIARSPRYAHFKETLQGLHVIRAFDQVDWSMDQFYNKLSHSTRMFYTHFMVNRWFSTRVPLIGAALSIVTGLMIIFSSYRGYIGAGTAGLVTLYALEFWRHLNWGVRIFSDLESRMTSVERLKFYSTLPAEEAKAVLPAPAGWPTSGELEFDHVNVRYADHLPQVLKNVSFKIPSGARAGLVGRTGSGKSTIFQTVYRFVGIESGDILIDGYSIQKLPLHDLRKNLAVIPQDPNLFMGSLRGNIDRYNQASDEDIWSILKKVSLEKFVQGLPDQLNFKVAEGGANLSQGQRQLICLARALLMKVKIIFLDEATASVDVETDAIVQKVIRESLDGITLVTIAHRLSTLDGYDMVIELQNGQIVK
ncbi:MAG: ATP-binding cassette domain-containing protein [Bdellovibrio sp.]|nr:ATP-binding cassette domain-containing protein [Bdellovibrio sp.]